MTDLRDYNNCCGYLTENYKYSVLNWRDVKSAIDVPSLIILIFNPENRSWDENLDEVARLGISSLTTVFPRTVLHGALFS